MTLRPNSRYRITFTHQLLIIDQALIQTEEFAGAQAVTASTDELNVPRGLQCRNSTNLGQLSVRVVDETWFLTHHNGTMSPADVRLFLSCLADDPWRGLRATLCAVAVAVVMLVFFIVVDKTRWWAWRHNGLIDALKSFEMFCFQDPFFSLFRVYIVKRIRGPPLPNPEKSFLRQANFQVNITEGLKATCSMNTHWRIEETIKVSKTPTGFTSTFFNTKKTTY